MAGGGFGESGVSTLDLWPIGNCQVSALVDAQGRFVWGCVPRVDGDPLFSALLGGDDPPAGFWSIELEDGTHVEQSYLRNTPVLMRRHSDAAGNAIEVIDFCPYFRRHGRRYRPVAFARIVRPVAGSPRTHSRHSAAVSSSMVSIVAAMLPAKLSSGPRKKCSGPSSRNARSS